MHGNDRRPYGCDRTFEGGRQRGEGGEGGMITHGKLQIGWAQSGALQALAKLPAWAGGFVLDPRYHPATANCPPYLARSSVFRSLPVAVCGNDSTKITSSGIHHLAMRVDRNSRIDSFVGVVPGFG